jgi:uncharacterized sulfatase
VFDGESFVGILAGSEHIRDRAVFWHYPVYHHDAPASVIRKGDWKLVHYLHNDQRYLYNLAEDIGETLDLSRQESGKADELFRLLEEWRKDVNAEFPVPNPAFDPERRYEWGRHPDRL